MKSIEFYYDFGSPTAYLAWSQIEKADVKKFNIEYKPVLLGGIFKATDNKPPGTVKAKANWMFEGGSEKCGLRGGAKGTECQRRGF